MGSKVKRVQLDMAENAISRLDALKEKTEATSYAEVIKNALRLYEVIIAEKQAGNAFMARDASGQLKQIILI